MTKDRLKLILVGLIGSFTFLADAPGIPPWLYLAANAIKYGCLPMLLFLCNVPVLGSKTPESVFEETK